MHASLRQAGFTLVEMMVVIVITGMISTATIVPSASMPSRCAPGGRSRASEALTAVVFRRAATWRC